MSGTETWKVIAGSPTPEELAAIVLVLGSGDGDTGTQAPISDLAPVGGWAARHRLLQPRLLTGPGAWQATVRR